MGGCSFNYPSPFTGQLGKCLRSKREPPSSVQLCPPPTPPTHLTPPSYFSLSLSLPPEVCVDLCTSLHVCVCVCVQQYEEMGGGGGSCSVQSQVHVLKCSPRDGQYYPCPLHQQGTGGLGLARGPLSPNRWKWAEERWRIGEEEENGQSKEKGREGGRVGVRVSLFSLSAVLKTTSPQQCVSSSSGWSPLSFRLTLGPSALPCCRKVCAHALRASTHGPIWTL